MSGRGGKRAGAGRKKGSKSGTTIRREEQLRAASELISKSIENVFDGDSHALLMAVYRNQDLPLDVRLDAAKAAIGYEKPRLAAVEHSGDAENPVQFVNHILGTLDGTSRGIPAFDRGEGTEDLGPPEMATEQSLPH